MVGFKRIKFYCREVQDNYTLLPQLTSTLDFGKKFIQDVFGCAISIKVNGRKNKSNLKKGIQIPYYTYPGFFFSFPHIRIYVHLGKYVHTRNSIRQNFRIYICMPCWSKYIRRYTCILWDPYLQMCIYADTRIVLDPYLQMCKLAFTLL